MNWTWILVAAAVTAFDLGLVWAVLKVGWGPWLRQYPSQEPATDAVGRNFQSFRIGLLNFGYCVHVSVDEAYLHLKPVRPLRWLGAGPISVPWSSIEPGRKSRIGNWLTVKIDKKTVVGPCWCLELAGEVAPARQGDSGANAGDA